MPTGPIVIVGAGQAGGWAARTLRSEGYAGPLVLIGDERHPPYERPPLSKAVLLGDAAPESTHLFGADVFDGLDVDFRSGARVVAIDRVGKSVQLADGALIAYDKLVLATGGRARTLPLDSLTGDGVFTLRTLEDSAAIGAAFETARTALVLGGGWIGLEIAAAARVRDVGVTLIEVADRLCHRAAPPALSDWLLWLHRGRGVDVRLGQSVAQVTRSADGMTARLTSGERVAADMIVVGAGLAASDELARTAGLACDDGVLTDPCGRTDDPDVFACGDVAVFDVPGAGRPMRLESWANAQNQAIACAKAVLGRDAAYDEIPWFWSDQYGRNIQILGLPPADAAPVRRGASDDEPFSLFWLDGQRLMAAVAVDGANDIKVARRLMARGIAVDADRLTDPEVSLRKLL